MPTKGKHGVRFEYVAERDVQRVSVAGTFNNWNNLRNAMTNRGNRVWEIELDIPKGRHLYKIVVEDTEWLLDPTNPNISEDGQNNSAFTVTEAGDVLIRTTDIDEQHPGFLYQHFCALESPEWIRQAVIYQLHLRAFDEQGFQGLTNRLGYLRELGVNTLWMMPFQLVGEQNRTGTYGDPYAVRDYYSIDGHYGTAEELKQLIGAAHASGMRVIMDWVMNRGSIDHVWTREHPEYFTRNEQGELYYEVPNRICFAGLNFDNPEMRERVVEAMVYWLTTFDFDGFRLDDSDITPLDFLNDIRQELSSIREDVVLISQSYDEYHHMEACDLTYDGSLRDVIRGISDRTLTQRDFMRIYDSYTYSFPRGALRMRWLEEKEQPRISEYLGYELAKPAASILMTVEGVPSLMMGQEFNEGTLRTWASLFEEYRLDWERFDREMYAHYQTLIRLRTRHAAFWKGKLEFVPNSEQSVLSYIRSSEEERFLVIVSLSELPLRVRLADATTTGELMNSRLIYRTGQGAEPGVEDRSEIVVAGYETLIYRLDKAAQV
ncbi:alpha-amylase family glycosyl hydrolase [Paenibacillus aurantiacus]|uniref:Alpha-amylase family glycosyl hydrolase n=1 Tax=Paenibacillus aurantiacus TaxID=1936118 RepID=A0ABV5KXT6_9BACL